MIQPTTLGNLRRTDYCGTLRPADEDREVVVCGWVQRQRDLGSLIFIDLRDRTGLVQLAFDDSNRPRKSSIPPLQIAAANTCSIGARAGCAVARPSIPTLPTGEIEVCMSPS